MKNNVMSLFGVLLVALSCSKPSSGGSPISYSAKLIGNYQFDIVEEYQFMRAGAIINGHQVEETVDTFYFYHTLGKIEKLNTDSVSIVWGNDSVYYWDNDKVTKTNALVTEDKFEFNRDASSISYLPKKYISPDSICYVLKLDGDKHYLYLKGKRQ